MSPVMQNLDALNGSHTIAAFPNDINSNFSDLNTNSANLVKNITEHLNIIPNLLNNHLNLSNSNNETKFNQDNYATWFELPKMDNFVDLLTVCCSTAVIFGGLVPYIPQYLKIKRSISCDGFSTYANIMRIMFWFGHHFELPLLIQSFVIITGMLAMMELCIRVKLRSSSYGISSIDVPANRRRRNNQIGLNLRNFWDWDDALSYVKFLLLFTSIMGMLTYLLLDNYLYVESIGFIAVLTESMLGMPQLLRNYSKKSTRGMSVEMVILWLSGDLFKTLYFIIRKAPTQFYVCGSIQVLVDVLILLQVIWYRRPLVTYRKLPKST